MGIQFLESKTKNNNNNNIETITGNKINISLGLFLYLFSPGTFTYTIINHDHTIYVCSLLILYHISTSLKQICILIRQSQKYPQMLNFFSQQMFLFTHLFHLGKESVQQVFVQFPNPPTQFTCVATSHSIPLMRK